LTVLAILPGAGCSPEKPAPGQDAINASAAVTRPAPASEAAARFEDITKKAGIAFVAENGKTPRKYLIETMGSGGGFIDYDGDGRLDILLLNGRPLTPGKPVQNGLRLYHNNGDGTFTDVTEQAGLDVGPMYAMGVAVGDYDNDGRDDIFVSCALGPSHLFHNIGARDRGPGAGKSQSPTPYTLHPTPSFEDVTAKAGVANKGMWGTSCCWVDYDRDGYLDLFVCNYVRYRTLADDLPCYTNVQTRSYCLPNAFAESHCTLYHNNRNGTFTDVSQKAGIAQAGSKALGVTVWDYDGDGWPDLFVANDTVPGFLFHNERNGTFTEVGLQTAVATDETGQPHSGMGIDATDTDNDGKISLVITNYSGVQVSFYRQIQTSVFQDARTRNGVGPPSSKYLGFGAFFFDYDNDAYKDLLVINGHVQDTISMEQPDVRYAEEPLLYHNQGDGTYVEIAKRCGPPFTVSILGRAAARGDIDNDGREDVLVTTNGGPAHLWRNVTGSRNHWLTFKLIGTKSNRDGIGALIRVTAGGQTQRDACRSGSSYLSASDLRVHFGLGAATQADVEIVWPSGTTDRLTGLAADRIWTVREGSGKAE
jgi:hypothetical protein